MKTKVYKIELLVVDHDEVGLKGVAAIFESIKYPNHCISPRVLSGQTREVDWSDEHPLNKSATWRQAEEDLFKTPE